MDKSLSLIGLMRKANKVSVTEQKCREDIRSGRSSLILIASDCSDNAGNRIRSLAESHNIPYADAGYTKDELASAAGTGLCSVISINDSGFAGAWLAIRNKAPEQQD
ncbi:MAG: ribosomal L7Ae/L30e/S12e/Gadd45 family protein [Oscillospiraceae bacterium]|nr:ribosomal L7Ae/L30e/S12e/Gadd45 family protein [Oscillospiraceae bacterium]